MRRASRIKKEMKLGAQLLNISRWSSLGDVLGGSDRFGVFFLNIPAQFAFFSCCFPGRVSGKVKSKTKKEHAFTKIYDHFNNYKLCMRFTEH